MLVIKGLFCRFDGSVNNFMLDCLKKDVYDQMKEQTMKTSMNDYVSVYKEQLAVGDIQVAYEFLIKYLLTIKSSFEKKYHEKYSTGNIGRGYLDITYFSFFDNYLRENKLRYGIVLNHEKMQFELWLMGRNAAVQKNYWNLLKTSKWNLNKTTMPKYSVLEVVLASNPDFDNLDDLTCKIIENAYNFALEITQYIKNLNNK